VLSEDPIVRAQVVVARQTGLATTTREPGIDHDLATHERLLDARTDRVDDAGDVTAEHVRVIEPQVG
jgi:hypothetical protein